MEQIRSFVTENGVSAVHVTRIPTFSIFKSFDCGQCFRFDPVALFGNKHEVGGVAFGKYVVFAQNHENEIIIYNSTKEDYLSIWCSYLALDVDYDKINEHIRVASGSSHMERAIDFGSGIRILRQDPWECIVSFIISQNNNIPRIKKIIASLCERYGQEGSFLGKPYYAFPSPRLLGRVSEEEFFDLRMGFRARYVFDACRRVLGEEIDLDYLKSEPDFDRCVEHLEKIKGVGLKVACCALLFGFERTEAFPVDVHMKRALEKYFPSGIDLKTLGKDAGIAQQYLFYYEKYSQSS